MKISVILRLLIGTLLPPILGALHLSLFMLIKNVNSPVNEAASSLFLSFSFYLTLSTVFAYAYVGIQSLVCSFCMEFFINRKISNTTAVIILGTFIGGLSGLPLNTSTPVNKWVFGFLFGLYIGAIVAYILRRLYLKYPFSKNLNHESIFLYEALTLRASGDPP